MLINCRECKQQVSNEAETCPHCGIKLNPQKKVTFLGWVGRLVLAAFVFVILVSLIAGNDRSPPNQIAELSNSAEEQPPVLKISANALTTAYDRNEAKADNDYKEKWLLVSGTVSSIDKDFLDHTILKLKGTNQFMDLMATLENDQVSHALNLHKGDSVSIICVGDGAIMKSPVLRHCSFQ